MTPMDLLWTFTHESGCREGRRDVSSTLQGFQHSHLHKTRAGMAPLRSSTLHALQQRLQQREVLHSTDAFHLLFSRTRRDKKIKHRNEGAYSQNAERKGNEREEQITETEDAGRMSQCEIESMRSVPV